MGSQRPVFSPAIWDSEPKEVPADFAFDAWDGKSGSSDVALTDEKQNIVQAWFPGTHSDVGGNSHVENSSVALEWMARSANRSGLEFEEQLWVDVAADTKNSYGTPKFGQLGASPSGVWKFAGTEVRDMSGNTGGTECIHPITALRASSQLPSGIPAYEVKNPGHALLRTCEGE